MPVRIRAFKDGFRRCGVAHCAEWTEHPDDAFSPEQLEILKAEPMLQVEVVPAEAETEESASPEAKRGKGKK